MNLLPGDRLERLALGLIAALVAVSFALLTPAALKALRPPAPVPTPLPPPPPPAAVLLPDELERALQAVVTLVADDGTHVTFGTAFLIDAQGDLLTTAELVSTSRALRVVDNTGGSHPVRVIGIDESLDLAEVRSTVLGVPLAFGDSTALRADDAVALLGSPKNASLPSSTPGTVSRIAAATTFHQRQFIDLLGLQAHLRPGNTGGPILGLGAKVLGMAALVGENEILDGYALPIQAATADVKAWQGRAGTLLPLAPMPSNLLLRGTGDAAPSRPSNGLSVLGVQPARASRLQQTPVTLQGAGFVAGPALAVRFIPVGSPTGGFSGVKPVVSSPSAITLTVPLGQVAQEYTVQLTNGDGATATSRTAFTVTP